MSKTGIEIIGIKNVHRVLEQLPKRINRKLLNQALGEAIKIFVKDVRNRAKKVSRKLGRAENFGVLPKNEQLWGRKLRVPYKIAGVRRYSGKGSKAYWGYLFYIFEYGAYKTPIIKAKSGGKLKIKSKSGKVKFVKRMHGISAKPILRPAADMTKKKVEKMFMKILVMKTKKFLDQMIKKYY